MPRVHRHDQHLLTPLLSPVLRHVLRMGEVVIHADERRADVGLLGEVGEAEARQGRGVVEDGGVILSTEARGEIVPGLGCGAVDPVD